MARELTGLKVMLTRARPQASELAALFESAGAEVVLCPTIDIKAPRDAKAFAQIIAKREDYDGLIFTSANGVAAYLAELRRQGAAPVNNQIKIATIGPATAEALQAVGLRVDHSPSVYRAEALAELLIKETSEGVAGKRFLLVRAEVARQILPQTLGQAGASVDIAVAYRAVAPEGVNSVVMETLSQGGVDYVTFTSSSTVRNFCEHVAADARKTFFERAKVACIGPITSETAQELGLDTAVEPTDYTVPCLFEAIQTDWLQRSSS